MGSRGLLFHFAGAMLLLVCGALPSSADIILTVSGPPVPSGGGFNWSYDAELTDNFEIQPSPAACAFAPPGASCDGLITIYDFAGYVAGSDFAPIGWTFSGAFLGETPVGVTPGSNIAGVDNPNLFNLSWTYTGPGTITASGFDVPLGSFGADSIYSLPGPSEYSARSNTLTIPNGRAFNSSVTLVPQVPEPATLLLVGGGLLGLAMAAKRRRIVR